MRKYWRIVLGLWIVLCAGIVFGQDLEVVEPSEIGKTIDWAWDMIFTKLIALVIGYLVALVLAKLRSKFGVELNERQTAMVNEKAMEAVSYAEEWAAKKIKDKITVASEDKFDKAVKKLTEKVPFLTEEKAKDLVVAVLPKFRSAVGEYIITALPAEE